MKAGLSSYKTRSLSKTAEHKFRAKIIKDISKNEIQIKYINKWAGGWLGIQESESLPHQRQLDCHLSYCASDDRCQQGLGIVYSVQIAVAGGTCCRKLQKLFSNSNIGGCTMGLSPSLHGVFLLNWQVGIGDHKSKT